MKSEYSLEPYGVIKKNGKVLSESELLQELRGKDALIVELHKDVSDLSKQNDALQEEVQDLVKIRKMI